MTKKELYTRVLSYFRELHPEVTTELEFGSVFQLLVAVVLSAQCTDKRVNQVTPELFAHYPDARAMAEADEAEIYEYVKSVSYPNAKARHLVELSRMLVDEYGGEVPNDFDALLRLPGVGRKTANVMQAVAFGQSAMPVDTHVYRVSHRLGLVPSTADTPLKVEKMLVKHIPAEDLARAHHWLLLHGRYVCTSRKPHCDKCELSNITPSPTANCRASPIALSF
jgi:endonuclease III